MFLCVLFCFGVLGFFLGVWVRGFGLVVCLVAGFVFYFNGEGIGRMCNFPFLLTH